MKRSLQRLIGILILVLDIFALAQVFAVFRQMNNAEEKLASLRETSIQLRDTNEALRFGIDHAGEDEVLSAAARNRLGLVLPEDKVFLEFGN